MTLDGGDGLSDTSSSGTIRPNRAIDASIVVRLHFAEAMAILLFNALDGKQQSSVKQGLNRLMAKMENVATPGVPPDAIRAYREALTAVQTTLLSNREPDGLALGLEMDPREKNRR